MDLWRQLNPRQQTYLTFSVIDQRKLTTTIFLFYLAYSIVSETALVHVLPPLEPDQICPSLSTINKVRILKLTRSCVYYIGQFEPTGRNVY